MKQKLLVVAGIFLALAVVALFTQCSSLDSKSKSEQVVAVRRSALTTPTGFDSMNIELGTSSPLIAPMKMTVAPDGRIFVCQQDGHIRIVKDDVLLPGNFLTISGVETFGDDGLQDIALDPDFNTTGQPGTGRFYTYHHFMNGGFGNGRVSIYRVSSGNQNVANSTPEATFDFDQLMASDGSRPGSHVGGTMTVGNDGMLYLSMGMQDASATTLADYTKSAGKIFRMNRATLAPASGNPFETSGANNIAKRIWGKGLRNPFGTAIDRTTGIIFIDDVGSNAIVSPNPDHKAWEETNHLPNPGETGYAGGAPFDFGWAVSEGTGPNLVHRYENGAANENTGGQDCAKIGGDFYRPATVTFPSDFIGAYFFADYCSTYIKYLPVSQQTPTVGANAVPSNVATDWIDQTGVAVTDIDTHPSGAVYVLGRTTPERQGSAVGLMYKIFASGPVPTVAVTSPNDGDRFLSGNPGPGTVSVPVTITADDTNGGLTLVEILQGSTVVGSCVSSPCSTTLTLSRGTYQLKGRATNVLANTKTSDSISVTVDGPTAVISTPLASATFVAGSAIAFSGSATNADGSTITSASAFVWNVYLNHGTHKHLEATYSGVISGSFTLSNQAETDSNIAVSFYLTVTDSFGVTHTAGRAIQPVKPLLTLATAPTSGLSVKIDSAFYASPFDFDSVAGIVRDIGVPIKQQHPTTGKWYEFQSWSDGGAYQHTITTPSTSTTYTATFRPATGSGSGLEGEYFPNTSLTGRLCDVVQIVDFDWGTDAPPCSGVPADGFSVRWSGFVQPYFSEDHTFYVQADGGVRLTVNGTMIINSWSELSSERVSGTVTLTGGSQYNIKLEYEDLSGPANVKLSWATSGVPKEVIPASQLFSNVVETGGEVLFVVGSASLTVADQAVSDRMTTTLGHTVDVVTAPALTSAMATASGRRLVVISDSVTSSDVGNKVTSAVMPLIDYEPALFDDLGFTTNNFGTSEGTTSAQTVLNIVAASDPLAAGLLAGSNTIVSSAQVFNWVVSPGGSPTVVARIVGSSTQAAIFRYNQGAAMQTGTAAHRRVGFFPNATTPSALNTSGWALFDAAFNWAFGAPPANIAPSVSAGSNSTAISGTSSTLSGSATDDGLPTGSTLTSTWTQTAGPSTATISNPTAVASPVSFPAGAAGTYTFRLTATDTALSSFDDVDIVVSLPTVDTPVISPGTGTYTSAQTVSVTDALPGSTIRYTLDGTDPSSSSTLYSATFVVTTNTTVKAKAFATGYNNSATATSILSFGTKTALLVVGNLTLNPSDAALQSRLQGLGFTVTTALDTAASGASGKSLVMLSETCASSSLGTKYTSTTTPVIVLEPAVQDEMGMTGATWGTNEGTATTTDVNVVATGPLTGGLSGQTTVATASSLFSWGVPSSSAFVISRVVGSSTQAMSYKYEQGASMVSGTAAGKRALSFPQGSAAVNLNASGWLLFDSLVSWAAP